MPDAAPAYIAAASLVALSCVAMPPLIRALRPVAGRWSPAAAAMLLGLAWGATVELLVSNA